jgi:fatty acid desaturase
MRAYRVTHRLHHNHLYKEQDPDVPIHAGYPRGRWYLIRKLLTDLTGVTAFKTYSYFFGLANSKRPLEDTSERLRQNAQTDARIVVAAHTAAAATALATGMWVEYAGTHNPPPSPLPPPRPLLPPPPHPSHTPMES